MMYFLSSLRLRVWVCVVFKLWGGGGEREEVLPGGITSGVKESYRFQTLPGQVCPCKKL